MAGSTRIESRPRRDPVIEAAAVLGGYLLGSLPFGYWLPRLFRHEDIRTRGSGNVGASNVFRVYGRRLGIAVALLDLGKGFAAALLGLWAGGALIGVLAGAAAMIGHARPIFLRFEKGGKMVATAGGAFLAVAPLAALGCVAVWLVVFLLTQLRVARVDRDGAALPVLVLAIGYPWPVLLFAAGGAEQSSSCTATTSAGSSAAPSTGSSCVVRGAPEQASAPVCRPSRPAPPESSPPRSRPAPLRRSSPEGLRRNTARPPRTDDPAVRREREAAPARCGARGVSQRSGGTDPMSRPEASHSSRWRWSQLDPRSSMCAKHHSAVALVEPLPRPLDDDHAPAAAEAWSTSWSSTLPGSRT